jgi:hypothetical protein
MAVCGLLVGIGVTEGYGVLDGSFVAVAVAVGVNVLVAVGSTGWNGVEVAGFSKNISNPTTVDVGDSINGMV